jgi:bifunctional oligoribonuclease and PAP phosphatase NrnA
MKIEGATFKKINELLQIHSNITIVTHTNPDGDAIGSSLALAGIIKQLKKNIHVVIPNDCPENLHWIDGYKDVILFDKNNQVASEIINNTDVFFCLDFNNIARIEDLGELIKKQNKPHVLIDHHPYPECIAEATISIVEASSTSELIFHTIIGCGLKHLLNKSIAEALYTGIITDTGCLSHNSSRPEVYQVVADLISYGIDKTFIHDELFNVFSFERMQLMGTVLKDNFVFLPEYKTAYTFISLENQKKFNFQLGDSEGFVNSPLAIKDVVFCALFTEYENKTIKVSFRSKRSFPANAYSAKFFNGGGHLNAAGGKRNCTLSEAIDFFVKNLDSFKELLLQS